MNKGPGEICIIDINASGVLFQYGSNIRTYNIEMP